MKVPRRLLKPKGETTTGILRKVHSCFVLGSPASVLDPDMCYPESEFSSIFFFPPYNSMVTVQVAP